MIQGHVWNDACLMSHLFIMFHMLHLSVVILHVCYLSRVSIVKEILISVGLPGKIDVKWTDLFIYLFFLFFLIFILENIHLTSQNKNAVKDKCVQQCKKVKISIMTSYNIKILLTCLLFINDIWKKLLYTPNILSCMMCTYYLRYISGILLFQKLQLLID